MTTPWGVLRGAHALASLRKGDALILTGVRYAIKLRVDEPGVFPLAVVYEATDNIFIGNRWQLLGTYHLVMGEHQRVQSLDWYPGFMGAARPHTGEASLAYMALPPGPLSPVLTAMQLVAVEVVAGGAPIDAGPTG
jgi:hypothetical protein